MATKTTHLEYCKRVRRLAKAITVLGHYDGLKCKIKHRCDQHNIVWRVTPDDILRGRGCYQCKTDATSLAHSYSHSDYVKKLAKAKPRLRVLGDYIGSHVKIEHKCRDCALVWKVRPSNLLNSSQGCPRCARLYRHVKLGSRIVGVRGFEPQAIKWLKKRGVSGHDIEVFSEGSVPIIAFDYEGRRRKHFPDLYLRSRNLLVEVKSLATIGAVRSQYARTKREQQTLIAMLEAKRQSAKKAGYGYLILCMDRKGRRIKPAVMQEWFKRNKLEIPNFIPKK